MRSNAIEAHDVLVRRAGTTILAGVNCIAQEGMVTGLIGPSGCGKTTFMRAVVGVQRTHGGDLQVLDSPAGTRELRGRIGYASQDAAVYPDLTVSENLSYFAAMVGVGRSRVVEVLQQVEMERFADQLVSQLSGGQRSRTSLAVALLASPRLLVLDEPTVGLDPLLREALWELFASLACQGVSLLVSSHVMDEARRCDAVILMREGKVLAQETPDNLMRRTATTDMDTAFLALLRDIQLRQDVGDNA